MSAFFCLSFPRRRESIWQGLDSSLHGNDKKAKTKQFFFLAPIAAGYRVARKAGIWITNKHKPHAPT